jgi:anti-anti-sigma factor
VVPPPYRVLTVPGGRVAVVVEDAYPVRWTGGQAVLRLPERIGAANSGQVREQLLELVDQGADVLIADMTATVSCDHRGADALLRAFRRASGNGTQLRVAVSAQVVRRVLDVSGLDRLVSIHPSVETAVAAGEPSGVIPLVRKLPGGPAGDGASARRPGGRAGEGFRAGVISPAALWGLVDALADGVILVDGDGVLVLANRRAEEMFGYARAQLAGQRVESLIPDNLREAHVSHRAGYEREPVARPMGARARLVGLRKDGGTFPVQVSLSPAPTRTGRFVLAVIRDMSQIQPQADLADMARVAAAAQQAYRDLELLLDRVVSGLYGVGVSLQDAADVPHELAVQRIEEALRQLDDTIREIHDHAFASGDRPGPVLPDGSQ